MRQEKENTQVKKKIYTAPRLTVHGNVQELTRRVAGAGDAGKLPS